MRFAHVLIAALAVGAAAASPAAAQSRASTAAARKAIDAANVATTAAFNAGKPRTFGAYYATNAVAMVPNSKAFVGRQAISDYWQGAYDAGFRNISVTTSDLIVRGDIAIESGVYGGEIHPTAAGAPIGHDTGKYVAIWQRRSGGKWMMLRDIYNSDIPVQ